MIGSVSTGILLALAGYYGPHTLRYWNPRVLKQLVARRRALVLTYDDGPSTKLTPQILDLLGSFQTKATFFVLGFRALANESVLARMSREQHEIGCHGYNHLNAWTTSPWKMVSDIGAGYRAISAWVPGSAPYRPPYGRLSLPVAMSMLYRRAAMCWWTVDSGDTAVNLPEPQPLADRVARNGGGVVLMHDFDRQQQGVDFVLRATDALLRTAKREGLAVCRYSDLWKFDNDG